MDSPSCNWCWAVWLSLLGSELYSDISLYVFSQSVIYNKRLVLLWCRDVAGSITCFRTCNIIFSYLEDFVQNWHYFFHLCLTEFIFFFIDFVYLTERESTGGGGSWGRGRNRGPHVGLRPGTLGSWPEQRADAQRLSDLYSALLIYMSILMPLPPSLLL